MSDSQAHTAHDHGTGHGGAEPGLHEQTRHEAGGFHAPIERAEHSWDNDTLRLVDLHKRGVPLNRVERAIAEEELAAQQRRHASPVVIRREEIVFETSSWPGVDVAYIVDPRTGIEALNFTLELHRLRPGARTQMHRHLERVCHVLNGRGRTLIDGEQIEWGPHDTFQIKMGAWHQHENTSVSEPAHILVGKADIAAKHLGLYVMEGAGDSFSDLPDDFQPEHPFTRAAADVGGYVEGRKWMSEHQSDARARHQALDTQLKRGRVLMRANEVKIERSQHKGDWRAALVDDAVGFHTRLMGMYVQQLPPDCHTETHRHGEAIVYVLSGSGYTIADGKRYDWRQGDCIFVQPGVWHQHFNPDPKRYSQHLTVNIFPLQNRTIHKVIVEAKNDPPSEPGRALPDDGRPGEWWR